RFMKILLEVLPTPLEIPSLGRVVRSDRGREASELVSAPENSAEVLPCPKGAHHSYRTWRRKAAPPPARRATPPREGFSGQPTIARTRCLLRIQRTLWHVAVQSRRKAQAGDR